MTSIAAGDGAQLGPAAENLGRRRTSGIYGAIITAAILDTVGGRTSTTVLVISIVVTLLVYWIAEEYAEVLGEHTAGGRLPSRAYIQGALAATSADASGRPRTVRRRSDSVRVVVGVLARWLRDEEAPKGDTHG